MSAPLLSSVLMTWEEAHRQGHDPSPAELLPEHPELHPRLAAAIDVLRGRPRRSRLVPFLVVALILAIGAGVGTSCYFAWMAAEEAAAARQADQAARAHQARAQRLALEAKHAARLAEQVRYAQQLAEAQRAWDDGNAEEYRNLLDMFEPPLRQGWEWNHLRGQLERP
jgi:hypothetical protein